MDTNRDQGKCVCSDLDQNRLTVILAGRHEGLSLHQIGLMVLREASTLKPGFSVVVDARMFGMDDTALTPLLSRMFNALGFLEIGSIVQIGDMFIAGKLLSDWLYHSSSILGAIQPIFVSDGDEALRYLESDLQYISRSPHQEVSEVAS